MVATLRPLVDVDTDGSSQSEGVAQFPLTTHYRPCSTGRNSVPSHLEFVLGRLGIKALLVAGIVMNGAVASTVWGPRVLDLHTVVLSDGCAAFGTQPDDHAIASFATVSDIATCSDVLGWLQGLS